MYPSLYTQAQQGCIDSSFHTRYKSQQGYFHTLKQITTSDKRTVIVGLSYDFAATPSVIVVKMDSTKNILWCKKIIVEISYTQIVLYSIEEAGNGNIAIAGTLIDNDTNRQFLRIILSPDGNILLQDIVASTTISKGSTDGAHTVCRLSADSLLFIYYTEITINGFGNEGVVVVVSDNNGNTGPSHFLALQRGLNYYNINFSAAKVEGGKLKLYGYGFSYCNNNFLSDNTAYVLVQYDMSAKKIDYLKAYCLPFSASLDHAPYSWNSVSHLQSRTFFLDNGVVAMVRPYAGVTTPRPFRFVPFFIAYFDSSFNLISSQFLHSTRNFNRPTLYDLLITPDGKQHFSFADYNTKEVFYAVADAGNKFLLQKKMKLPDSNYDWGNTFGTQVLENGKLTGFTINSVANNQTFIDYVQIRPQDTAAACFGTDTSFLSFIPSAMSPIPPGPVTAEPTGIISTPLNLTVVDFPMIRENICMIKRICDTIKINAPAKICDIDHPVIITAHKNPLCNGKINFQFDTAQVQSYTQVNDTTLSLRFSKSYKGKIMAQASSCDKLKDSVEIIISAPMQTINLGNDTTYCPGHSYILNAYNPSYKNYTWQDGNTDSVFTATALGNYFVTVTDACGRVYTDTIKIRNEQISLRIEKDTSICLSESVMLQATAGFYNYNWNPVTGIISTTGNKIEVQPQVSTSYSVVAEKFPGCLLSDTILVKVENCPQYIYFPNSFTPDNDNLNDKFKPLVGGTMQHYELVIYNRWGNLVFKTNNKQQGWNGFYNGVLQQSGAYVWYCKYQFYNKPEAQKKGTFVLIR